MKVAVCLLIVAISCFTTSEAATTFDHAPLVYNFYDILAQAACVARGTTNKRIWAIRRSSTGHRTCHHICNPKGLRCIHAYYVYKNPTILSQNIDEQTDEGVKGLSMTNYVNCNYWTVALGGPNYCCCEDF